MGIIQKIPSLVHCHNVSFKRNFQLIQVIIHLLHCFGKKVQVDIASAGDGTGKNRTETR